MMIDLHQSELDYAFHTAYFECEAAAVTAIREAIQDRDFFPLRDALIEAVSTAMYKVELQHLGERYPALMDRLGSVPLGVQ